MLAQSRALVVFADNCADLPEGLSGYRSLNRVAAQGVNGWLSISRPEQGGKKPGVALAQLLGVMPECIADVQGELGKLQGFEKGHSGSLRLSARYGGLDIRLVTNQPSSQHLQDSMGVPCTLVSGAPVEGSNSGGGEFEAAVLKAVQDVFDDSSSELVILHLDADALGECQQGNSDHESSTRRCLSVLDQVMLSQCGDGSIDMLQLVAFGIRRQEVTMGNLTAKDDWQEELRPCQSSRVHNGVCLHVKPGESDRLTYALYHSQASRRDKVEKLTERHVSENGANGGSLAQHLMVELAFLLGHMPKYGA